MPPLPLLDAAPPLVAMQATADLVRRRTALEEAFGAPFSIWDGETGALLLSPCRSDSANAAHGQLCRGIAGSEPQYVADEDVALLLGIPLGLPHGRRAIATGVFAVRDLEPGECVGGVAALLGVSADEAQVWLRQQPLWTPHALLRLAKTVQAQLAAEDRAKQLEQEVEKVSDHLAATYEEICLLHGVTQHLRIHSDEEQLASLVLRWLLDCLPAEGIAIQLLPVAREGQTTYKARTRSEFFAAGNCPVDNEQFSELVEKVRAEPGYGPYVANHSATQKPDWPLDSVRQLIVVPMAEGARVFGWLAAFNHVNDGEFGTIEASLLNSVGAILGIHSSNRDLYRQQSEFLASVVRALTSAIDAKDPYTCGHSDRVARISVRLAKELQCDSTLLHTLYMAGLLHDIGKIGIDDAVLRKPSNLTEEEFEHIKQHPELGYRILADIKEFAHVLPAVLHHHEQWDGKGYPHQLAGEQIPFIARIVAVADAYDAMTSDRPYRHGMEIARVEELFERGAGQQWDPAVVEAYFAARTDIQAICREERANLTLDVQRWT